MKTKEQATARPWKVSKGHPVDVLNEQGHHISACTFDCAFNRNQEQNEANAALIVQAVNEHAALNAVAEDCEKLRVTINALLTELPDKSEVNGEDNFPFRLRVLKIQVTAEKNLAALASIRQEGAGK